MKYQPADERFVVVVVVVVVVVIVQLQEYVG